MKIIFLDVDGVLNGYGKWTELLYGTAKKLSLLRVLKRHHDIFGVHKRKVKLLHKIVKKTNAKIVMSSSWRGGYFSEEKDWSRDIKKLHKLMRKYDMECIDRTGRSKDGNREAEIREWLSRHEDIENFIVIDDEQFDLQGFIGKELVRTCDADYVQGNWWENTGLKRKHVKQAIKILNVEVV